MKALKSLFVQRFSAFDLLVLCLIWSSPELTWLGTIIAVVVWTLTSVIAENHLGIRTKNSNTPWCDL